MRSLAVAMMLVGCSGGGLDVRDYPSSLRDANCELRSRCGQFPDVASCEPYFPIGDYTALFKGIDQGVIKYDGDKAQECINDIADSPCDQTSMEARNLPDACTQAVTGTVAVGAPCTENAECESSACSLPSCGQACCTGMCVARPVESALGGPCATVECQAGLVCDNTKTCVELYVAGTPCLLSSDCAYGLACAGDPGICKVAPKLGEACPDFVCAELGAYCSSSGTCTAFGLLGDACMIGGAQCSTFYPCDFQAGQCKPNPTINEACNGLCSDGSYCDPPTGLCIAPLADGLICSTDPECASGDCDTTQNPKVCVEPTVCF